MNSCISNISTNYWISNSCISNISTNYWISNTSLQSLNSCVSNISSNYWLTNSIVNQHNSCIQNISLNFWGSSATNITALNTCISNISTNYWISNTSLQLLNSCISNISTNYWISNSSLQLLNSCISNISTNYWISNSCISNISLNYWKTNSSLNSLNSCIQNVSMNYWITNSSFNSLNSCIQNVSRNYWLTNSSLSTVLSTYITSQPVNISTANACITNCSVLNIYSTNSAKLYSKTTVRKDCSGFSFTNNQFEIAGLTNPNCKLRICVDTTSNVAYIGSVNEYTSWIPLYINTEGGSGNPQNTTIGNNYSILNLSGSSILLNGVNTNTLATQSYVTGLNYITATPGAQLSMNSNNITFTNNGAGLVWGNYCSQIYDDANLHITTDDSMYISAIVQLIVTAANTYFSGNVYMNNNLLLTSTPGVDINMNTNNVNLTNGKLTLNGNGIIYFYSNSNLATTYAGARIVLWPGSGTSSSTDWYGFGMNGGQLVYNVPSGQAHSFQVNGAQVVSINSNGITVGSSTLATQSWVTSQNYLTSTGLLTPTGITLTTTRSISFGSHNAYICNYETYFSIFGGNDTSGNPLLVNFFQNPVEFGGYLGRPGSGATTTGNVINTWWDGSHLFLYVDTSQVWNNCDRRIKQNIVPMRSVLDRLCTVQCIEYELKDIGIFKNDGTTRIGVFADELEDTFPEYKGNVVLGNRDAVDNKGEVCPQNIGIQFEFLLLKAIQELKMEIDFLKQEIIALKT